MPSQYESERKIGGRAPGNRDAEGDKYQRSQRKPGKRGWVGDISGGWVEYEETSKWKILRERQGRELYCNRKRAWGAMKMRQCLYSR